MHELVHAWMRSINPKLAANYNAGKNTNTLNSGTGNIFEAQAIKIENAVAKARGEDDTRVFHLSPTIHFYKSKSSTSTEKNPVQW